MKALLQLLALLASLIAVPALAEDACDDVWFTRNLHFDRAGYCFGSALGQAIFDNSNCVGQDITLDPRARDQVAKIRELEAYFGCNVDTSRTWIEIGDMAIRRQLYDLPIRDDFESGCLGWQGAPLPLRAGIGPGTPVIGRIEPGDYVLLSFMPVQGWSYVTIHTPDFAALKSGGWVPDAAFVPDACAGWAG